MELPSITLSPSLSEMKPFEEDAVHLELLTMRHSQRLEHFERANRAFFASRVGDRGDDYFNHFTEQLAARVTENDTGQSLFCVLVAATGQIVGRVNISDIAQPSLTELGFRVDADRQGRGVATRGVLAALSLARDRGLRSITARAAIDNLGSRRVLERTGFTAIGPVDAPPASDGSFVGYRVDLSRSSETPTLT